MSDANTTAIRFIEEATLGTTPASPALRALRVTSASLSASPQTVVSNELVSTREVSDLSRVGFEAGGSVEGEFSHGVLDDVMPSIMMNSWVWTPTRDNNGTADSNITDVAVGTGVYTVVASDGTKYKTGTFALGHLVRMTGFTAAANNGLFRVTTGSDTAPTTDNSGSVADTAPAAAARIKVVGFEGASGDIEAQSTGGNALTSTTLDFTTLGLAAGMWIKIGGSAAGEKYATAACNGWARISAVAANLLSLDRVPTGWTDDTGAAKTIQVFYGDYVRNGTTKKSLTIEQTFSDLTTPEYFYLRGSRVESFGLSGDTQAIMTYSLAVQSVSIENTTTRVSGATNVAAPTNTPLNTSDDVGRVAENDTELVGGTNPCLSMSFTLNNNVRRQPQVGSVNSAGIGIGRSSITGSLTTYYESNQMYTKLIAGTETNYDLRLVDPGGTAAIVLDLPRIKFTSGDPSVPGIDTDRVLAADYQALRHATLGYTVHYQTFEYVVTT